MHTAGARYLDQVFSFSSTSCCLPIYVITTRKYHDRDISVEISTESTQAEK